AERHCITVPLPGVTITMTCVAFAFSESRNITPAFAHGDVWSTLLTRAVIVTSPLDVVWMYWKSSDESQTSFPRLLIETLTSSVDADPLPGPIVVLVHGSKSAGLTFEKTPVAVVPS